MTNSQEFNSVLISLFNSAIIMAWVCGFTLDMIVPGTRKERGLGHIDEGNRLSQASAEENPEYAREYATVYALPQPLRKLLNNCAYLERIEFGKWPAKAPEGAGKGTDVCSLCWPGSVWCGGKSKQDASVEMPANQVQPSNEA